MNNRIYLTPNNSHDQVWDKGAGLSGALGGHRSVVSGQVRNTGNKMTLLSLGVKNYNENRT